VSTWLQRTRQEARFYGAAALTVACLLPIAFTDTVSEWLGVEELLVGLLSLGLAVVGLVVFGRAVRCPRCGTRAVWQVLRTAPSDRWFGTLRKLQACPRCGDRAERTPASHTPRR